MKLRTLTRPALPALMALITCYAANAQDKTAEIDKIFSWASPATPGCVCAVASHGKLVFNKAYGAADLEKGVPLDTNTVFDIGSSRKQFVAAAILLLVEDKKLKLTDDVRKYIPELPDYGYTITIDHLLTHTSGLRDWTAIQPLAADKADALTLAYRQRGLNFAPGEEWAYSNTGYALAKEIVDRVSGTSFAHYVQQRIFDPLGMKKTSYADDLYKPMDNRATGYEKEGGKWEVSVLLGNERGGGGALFSTAADLVRWNEALTGSRLGKFVTAKLQEPAVLNNGRKLDYGRGLMLDTHEDLKIIWHTGSAAGYKSLTARFPEPELSVAITCNSGDGTDRLSFAQQIFELYVPDTAAQRATFDAKTPPPPDSSVYAGLDLNRYAGLYFEEHTNVPLRLGVDRGRLRVAGGPALTPVGKDRFKRVGAALLFLSGDAFEVSFKEDKGLDLISMEGKTTHYRRAADYAPAADDMKALAGKYESKEIGSVLVIEPGEKGLVVKLGHAPDKALDFKPADTDAFMRSMMQVRFVRDKNGKVTGFDYSNLLVRSIRFERVAE